MESSVIGKNFLTPYGKSVTILNRRKSRTVPFFETFNLYDVLIGEHRYSIRCDDLDNLINGRKVIFVFD